MEETRGWLLCDIKSLKHILKLIRSDRDQMENLKGIQGTGPGIDFLSLPSYFQAASRADWDLTQVIRGSCWRQGGRKCSTPYLLLKNSRWRYDSLPHKGHWVTLRVIFGFFCLEIKCQWHCKENLFFPPVCNIFLRPAGKAPLSLQWLKEEHGKTNLYLRVENGVNVLKKLVNKS